MRLSTVSLAVILVSFTTTSAHAVVDCVRPPPFQLPTIQDCEDTLDKITTLARMQGNIPRTWSRHPPYYAGQKVPAIFCADKENMCEVVVDVIDPYKQDVFLTSEVARAAREIVDTCLIGEALEEDTVGLETVGPKGVVSVLLRLKPDRARRYGYLTDAFVAYNMSDATSSA